MAHATTEQNTAQSLGLRATTTIASAARAVGYFFAVTGRANAMQPLLTATEAELAGRGLTRQQLVDYIIDGRTAR